MTPTAILLAALPRMLTEIIETALATAPDLRIAGRVREPATLGGVVERLRPDVVIVGLQPNEGIAAYETLVYAHPRLKLLGITPDGSDTRLFELRPRLVALGSVSPDGLLRAIRAATAPPDGDGS